MSSCFPFPCLIFFDLPRDVQSPPFTCGLGLRLQQLGYMDLASLGPYQGHDTSLQDLASL
jgi:hypothetical protein